MKYNENNLDVKKILNTFKFKIFKKSSFLQVDEGKKEIDTLDFFPSQIRKVKLKNFQSDSKISNLLSPFSFSLLIDNYANLKLQNKRKNKLKKETESGKGKDKEGTSCLLPLDINTLIAGSCLGSIEVYDVRSGKLEKCIGSLGERHGFVRIGKNGHLAAYVSDNEIVLTDIKNDKIIEKIPTDDYAKDLHISDDCKEILIGFGSGKVSILSSEKEK